MIDHNQSCHALGIWVGWGKDTIKNEIRNPSVNLIVFAGGLSVAFLRFFYRSLLAIKCCFFDGPSGNIAETQISTAYNVFDKLPDGQSKKQQFIAKRLILKNLRNATDNPPAKTIKLTDGLRISFFIASLLQSSFTKKQEIFLKIIF